MPNRIEIKKIKSQNLSGVGYDKSKRELHVTFNWTGDKVYVYEDVPLYIYQNLIGASSVGSYFHSKIRYKYNEGKNYYSNGRG